MAKEEDINKEVQDIIKKDAESIRECEAIAKKHNTRKVYKLTLRVGDEDSEDMATAFFRKPSRVEFSAAVAIQQRDPMKAKGILLNSMFLEGDRRVIEDDYAFMCAALYVDEMVGLMYGDLKKN
ncbi:hypothetical protein SDC9_91447 [bioreactor metagenome]|uniref:Uncharacterized protein n=1 Tax=bioreactor metagenome TaxID=1076179 RepID=A0A644ZVN4_9ZZZZ